MASKNQVNRRNILTEKKCNKEISAIITSIVMKER